MICTLQAHPGAGKEERKSLWRLIDARKLSAEAAAHAVQNDRLPVRSVMQVLFSEHGKLNRLADLGASFSGASQAAALDPHSSSGRCPSKREVLAQHQEMRRLREDVARLQVLGHFPALTVQSSVQRYHVAGANEVGAAGAVQRAAGAGGEAGLGEEAARRRWVQVDHVLVRRRRHERGRREDRGVGERHGAANAGERDEGQGRPGDADANSADPEVAQVHVVMESEAGAAEFTGVFIRFCFSFSFNSSLALVFLLWQIMNKMNLRFFFTNQRQFYRLQSDHIG
jgi:hypothetical protein